MNQGKLDVVKQEMARVNIDILGISKLKWMGVAEFNSDDHYIYYCGQESLRKNGVNFIVTQSNTLDLTLSAQPAAKLFGANTDPCDGVLFPSQSWVHSDSDSSLPELAHISAHRGI